MREVDANETSGELGSAFASSNAHNINLNKTIACGAIPVEYTIVRIVD